MLLPFFIIDFSDFARFGQLNSFLALFIFQVFWVFLRFSGRYCAESKVSWNKALVVGEGQRDCANELGPRLWNWARVHWFRESRLAYSGLFSCQWVTEIDHWGSLLCYYDMIHYGISLLSGQYNGWGSCGPVARAHGAALSWRLRRAGERVLKAGMRALLLLGAAGVHPKVRQN